ncbi:DMT family transporter [uncultured Treponema sp.]|uniref:DMT family transporter n=1 Tax=uncultured Treponema sp. TaxID=162155 RepID=UPI0025F1F222|nr:DMT family transporter [uncultured Treponema sp.]
MTEKKSSSFLSNIWVVSLGAALCSFLWGSATPAIKTGYALFSIAADDTPTVVLFAGIRFFFAGIFTTLFGSLIQKKVLLPRSVMAFKKVVALAMVQTILQYFFFYGGLTRCPGVKSSVILATNVFASLLIAALLFKQEKLTLLKILGCVIGFVGVVLVTVSGKSVDYHISFGGEGFIFLSSLCYGLSGCLMKSFSRDDNTVMLSGWQFTFGGAVMIFTGFCLGGRFSGFTALSVLLLAYLVFISAVAYTLWGLLLAHNDVSRVVIFGFLNPVFGVILSSIFLHEQSQTGLVTIISLILVCIGIFIVNYRKRTERK